MVPDVASRADPAETNLSARRSRAAHSGGLYKWPLRPAAPERLAAQTTEQRFLSEDESFAAVVEFRRRHPWRLRLISSIFGWGDLRSDTATREFVRARPFVAFRPVNPVG